MVEVEFIDGFVCYMRLPIPGADNLNGFWTSGSDAATEGAWLWYGSGKDNDYKCLNSCCIFLY